MVQYTDDAGTTLSQEQVLDLAAALIHECNGGRLSLETAISKAKECGELGLMAVIVKPYGIFLPNPYENRSGE